MKITLLFILGFSLLLLNISCKKEKIEEENKSSKIVYKSVNKEFVLIRDVDSLQSSDDEISNHIDSIINGLINAEFISTGMKSFDLNGDSLSDINFEIINLNEFNQNSLPESFDSLAARVQPLSLQILDNSTYGYPDALDINTVVSESGYWSSNVSVLGTFMNAGQFQGKVEKYLGIRLNNGNNFDYGWIKLYCSQHNDTLRIIEYAYNQNTGSFIKAGQKE